MKIKKTTDYIDDVHSMFPEMKKEDIREILMFGFKNYFSITRRGADIKITSGKGSRVSLFFYNGYLFFDSLVHIKYHQVKSKIKARILYLANKPKWDNYYYFGLTEDQYSFYKSQVEYGSESIIFGSLMLYRVKEEMTANHTYTHHFKIKIENSDKYLIFLENYETSNAIEL